jgi:hypothetical protein
MNDGARIDAERGHDSDARALREAAPDDVERVLAGRQVEQRACDHEEPIVMDAEHSPPSIP